MEFEELYNLLAKDISFVYMVIMIMTLRRTLLRKHLLLFGKNWKHLEMNPALGLGFSSNNCLRQIEKKIGFKSRTS
jgi:hypothetical protein